MLRNLSLAGLTALAVMSLASPAAAARGAAGRKPDAIAHHAQEPELDHGSLTPAKKKPMLKTPARRRARGRVVRRVKAAVMNQTLLRQSWTVADLNPMPALLDLDDTTRNLRRATAEIVHMMTR
jgi:hypothetical protein